MATLARKATKSAVLPPALFARRGPADLVALLYHRVGDAASEIELTVAAFARQLDHLAADGRVVSIDRALEGGGGVLLTFDDGTPDFHATVLPMLAERRLPAVLYLATSLVAPATPDGLTWSQVEEIRDSGLVTIGSHTHGHADLSGATEEEAFEEMRIAKETIEDRLGVPSEDFAYPWAVGSAGADAAARRLFRSAALDAWRTNRAGRLDPYRIGRVPILRSDGDFFFRRKVAGRLDTEAWVYRALRRGPWGRG